MNASNLKDTLSTIFGIMGSIAALILGVQTQGIVLPTWLSTTAAVLAAVSVAGIGILTGKAPNGATKTPDQVAEQNPPKP